MQNVEDSNTKFLPRNLAIVYVMYSLDQYISLKTLEVSIVKNWQIVDRE